MSYELTTPLEKSFLPNHQPKGQSILRDPTVTLTRMMGSIYTYKRYLCGNSCPVHVLHTLTVLLKSIMMNCYDYYDLICFFDISLAKLEGRVI